jgi:elongation factor G
MPPVQGVKTKTGEVTTHPASESVPFSALAFKAVTDPFMGRLVYFRVYSGKMKAGAQVLNSTKGKKERLGRLLQMHANYREEINEVRAGDIAAALGLKDTFTGDTLCDFSHPILLEAIHFPVPIVSVAIEPRAKADQDRIGDALTKLSQEDPTFKTQYAPETGQTIISGMGELHLEVLLERMRREFKVEATTGRPQVAYKETLTQAVRSEGRFIKQFGGRGQYGHVWLELEPGERGSGFQFNNRIRGGIIPKEFIPAVEAGVKEALERGVLGGYPTVDIKVTFYDGSFHQVDSSEIAFRMAGSIALKEGMRRAKPVLLEPIMKLEVDTPEQFLGDIIAALEARRARIETIETQADIRLISAYIPLAETFGYASEIRSLSQGRAVYFMEFQYYQELPLSLTEQVIRGR